MSDLKTKAQGILFVPVLRATAGRPAISSAYLVLGAIYPAVVIAIELASRICAQALFDPMPTVWHVLAVAFVPAMIFAVWARFGLAREREARWLAFGTGMAVAIALSYAALFVPFVPLAIFAVVFYGFGLLPLAPIAAAVCACALLWLMLARRPSWRLKRAGFAGIWVGLAAMIGVEVPMVATRIGVQMAADGEAVTRSRGVALLRMLGDDDLLLRLCYGANGRPAGPLGMMVMVGEGGLFSRPGWQTLVSPAVAREIYFRVHGVAFNAVRPPAMAGQFGRADEFAFDDDLGGAQVGGRIKGLSLTSSRIDGSISGDDAVAYLEWTFAFANTSAVDREARLELALPPGAVVSRATLWINGEEREAAYGGRGEVRAAYQKIAVQQRRDPLLVTTKGADRVLAQAFPVPRNGGTIMFKLGISAPLDLSSATAGRLVLPAIFDRNFNIGGDVRHAIWIDSKTALAVTGAGLVATEIGPDMHRVSGTLDDGGLTRVRQGIGVVQRADAGSAIARLGAGAAVVQDVKANAAETAGAVMVVIDGSAMLAHDAGAIARALAAIPIGTRAGVMIASDPVVRLPLAPWSAERQSMAAAMISSHAFVGGQDNTAALSDALLALESETPSRLLWVHGPQPQAFAGGTARLEQVASRLGARAPALAMYAVAAGPNGLLPDVPWGWRGRLLPKVEGIERDLASYFKQPDLVIERREANLADVARMGVEGSAHIARIWTRDQVVEMMAAATGTPQREEQRLAAVALAAHARLITPISGAVVLETQQQYDENRLTPVGQATVPTVPEPHEWALIGIAGMMLIWLMGRPSRQRAIGGSGL